MDVEFEAQVTPEGVNGVDQANAHIRVEVCQDFPHGLNGHPQEHLQESALAVEEGAQQIIDRQGDVDVRNIEQVPGDIIDPIVHADLTAGRAEAGLAGKGNFVLIPTTRADIEGVPSIRVAAEHHALNCFADVCLLIRGDFLRQAQVAPDVPVVAENLSPAVGLGRASGVVSHSAWQVARLMPACSGPCDPQEG